MIRVLVVERDTSLAQLYREELEEAGFGVQVLRDLDSALVELRTKTCHLLVTDLVSMGEHPKKWLPTLRRVYGGPIFALSCVEEKTNCREPDFSMLRKTSDLRPLIRSLRGRSVRYMWQSYPIGNC